MGIGSFLGGLAGKGIGTAVEIGGGIVSAAVSTAVDLGKGIITGFLKMIANDAPGTSGAVALVSAPVEGAAHLATRTTETVIGKGTSAISAGLAAAGTGVGQFADDLGTNMDNGLTKWAAAPKSNTRSV